MSGKNMLPRILSVLCVLAAVGAAADQESATAPSAKDILARAGAAIDNAGAIKARINIENRYPVLSKSRLLLVAAPDGSERAEISTTIKQDTFKALQVVRDNVIWTENYTPAGPVVTKLDLKEIHRRFSQADKAVAAIGILRTGALWDFSGLSRIVEFSQVSEETLGETKVYVLTGALKERFAKNDDAFAPAARRYYSRVSVYVDAESFLPRRIDLGREAGEPLMRLDVESMETNFAPAEGTFDYTPPADVTVIDRTDWAIRELEGSRSPSSK